MHRILFVCLGNICRSPMAEMILKDMVRKRGIEKNFEIASCATSTEEVGNPAKTLIKLIQLYHSNSKCQVNNY